MDNSSTPGKKGPLYKVTNKITKKTNYMTNWQLICYLISIAEKSPTEFNRFMNKSLEIEKIENPTPAEWLLYSKEDQ